MAFSDAHKGQQCDFGAAYEEKSEAKPAQMRESVF